MAGFIICVLISAVITEFLGYWLHRLLHSGRVHFLSRSHMIHHLVLYGPLHRQRPGPNYQDPTTGKLALDNIGLEWLVPSALVLGCFLGLFWIFQVRLLYQGIFVSVTLGWGFPQHRRPYRQEAEPYGYPFLGGAQSPELCCPATK